MDLSLSFPANFQYNIFVSSLNVNSAASDKLSFFNLVSLASIANRGSAEFIDSGSGAELSTSAVGCSEGDSSVLQERT